MDNSIELILEDTPVKVNPDNIIWVLEANQDVPSVTFVNCSAPPLLAFLPEVQNIAVDTHIVKPMQAYCCLSDNKDLTHFDA